MDLSVIRIQKKQLFVHFALRLIGDGISVHNVRDCVKENVEKMLNCGDKDKLGYGLYECKRCGERHYVAHTCKSRFCNSCGKIATDNWIAKAQKRFVNVPLLKFLNDKIKKR